MEFIQVESLAKIQIQSYHNGVLRINDTGYQTSLIALPNQLIPDWQISHIDQLNIKACEIFRELQPELLLIGTGPKLIFPAAKILGQLRTQGFGVEVMDTAAACRTFQILTAENRQVVAALII
jgi:uncharacterized protein